MVITTLTGENDAERLREQARIVGEFVAEYTDMGLERLDGEDASYEQLLAAVQSLPFLVTRKLVVIRGASNNKELAERFEQFLDAVTDSTDVLFVEGKLDKRTALYKQLKKLTDFKEYGVLDAAGSARFAGEYVKEQGGALSAGDARLLIERVGIDQLGLRHELDKLLAYSPKITRQSIELLTDALPQSKIFELLDAAFAGRTKQLLVLYKDQRAQDVEPQQIVAMLVWQLYIFAVVKAGQNKPASEIARTARLSPYVVEKSQALMRRTTLARLKEMISELRALDVRSKSEGIVLDEALQHYLLTLTAQ